MIKPCEHRMYVIVREDLTFKLIQGQHALAQFAIEQREQFEKWGNETIINLSVFNGLALEELNYQLFNRFGTTFSYFVEPDLKSDLPTAICIYEDGSGCVSDSLRSLKLASK